MEPEPHPLPSTDSTPPDISPPVLRRQPPPLPVSGCPYRDYSEVPWHQKSSSIFILILILILVSGGLLAVLLMFILIFVRTPAIYCNKKDQHGNLKTWTWRIKTAILLLILGIGFFAIALGTFFGMGE